MQKKLTDIQSLVRKNILNLKPYSSARDEFEGEAEIFLDANENPFPSPYNRYPDPLQKKVKEKLARIRNTDASRIFLGNGSDEAIDLLIRAFCEPHSDSILIAEPTYGMYAVCADVNAVNIQKVPLTTDFDLDVHSVMRACTPSTKLIFLCSPNNPTGNILDREKVMTLLETFRGVVVVDEAYIDFANTRSFVEELEHFPNLVVMQTFSKAWGLAGLRLGICYASEYIISLLNKIKYPYNVNIVTQQIASEALEAYARKDQWVESILKERAQLKNALAALSFVQVVYRSDANFVLVKMNNARAVYHYLMEKGIIVRDRSRVSLCDNCLRITVGTSSENQQLIQALKTYEKSPLY